MSEVERFLIDDAVIEAPVAALNERVRMRLSDGRFERYERGLLQRHLRPGDRVLDAGAGLGLVSIVAARVVGPTAVMAVEANPDLIRTLKRNLRLNVGQGVTVINAAVGGDAQDGHDTTLHVHAAFWSASVNARHAGKGIAHQVRTRSLSKLLRRADATVLSMDIEGAEIAALSQPLPTNLRLIVMELHPILYRAGERDELLNRLAAQGFHPASPDKTEEVVALIRDI
ncbi:MAG: hypothetical protein DI498_07805 [Paracoccus denitrificans]|nr:MAG: hypothetical protein DI498_07805 [Paracoccus denitrificans]PZO84431.1 MAG: hypothetical protein DI633_07805 [Paracoccus denitrificans]